MKIQCNDYSKSLKYNSCSFLSYYDVPKCMSCHKFILVITGRTHCFYIQIYKEIPLPDYAFILRVDIYRDR